MLATLAQWTLWVDHGVTELASATARTAVETAVDDNTHAHPTANGDSQEIVNLLAGTIPAFRQGQGVHVIVQVYRRIDALLEHVLERHILPLVDRALP